VAGEQKTGLTTEYRPSRQALYSAIGNFSMAVMSGGFCLRSLASPNPCDPT
jgi:hypothetical protein